MIKTQEFEAVATTKRCPNCDHQLSQIEYYDYEPGPDTLTLSPLLKCGQCGSTFDKNLQKAALPEEKMVS